MTFEHISVLKNEVLEHLTFAPDTPARLIDGTLGGGGHSFALLEKYPSLELLGIDRDDNALHAASEHLAPFRDRIKLVKGNYSELGNIAEENGWKNLSPKLPIWSPSVMKCSVAQGKVNFPVRHWCSRHCALR